MHVNVLILVYIYLIISVGLTQVKTGVRVMKSLRGSGNIIAKYEVTESEKSFSRTVNTEILRHSGALSSQFYHFQTTTKVTWL